MIPESIIQRTAHRVLAQIRKTICNTIHAPRATKPTRVPHLAALRTSIARTVSTPVTMLTTHLVALILAAGIQGCGSDPTIDPIAFTGPPLRIEPFEQHLSAVMTAPSQGWRLELDRTLATLGGHDIYLTLRRPDPQFVYPQVIVEQRVLTDLDEDESARIVARIMNVRDRSQPNYAVVDVPSNRPTGQR